MALDHFSEPLTSAFLGEQTEEVRNHLSQVEVDAGDLIIFTEALVHGTMEWNADYERRSLLYKYSPGHSSWSATYYYADDYPDATEQQKRMLAPPSIGGRPDTADA